MPLAALLSDFAHHLQSDQFRDSARHPDHPTAFQRRRKLPLPALNDGLIEQADQRGYVPRWHGYRLVAADASSVRFGLRASHVQRAAMADQLVFGLFLPSAELMLSASLHGTDVGERQMLFEQFDRLAQDDLLLLDRGYPCYWMLAVLNQRKIAFCMRVKQARGAGFPCAHRTSVMHATMNARASRRPYA
jgi:hypothetical protein